MNDATLDISEARKQIATFEARLRKEPVIWITRRNKKAFAIVDTELLQTVMETIEILSDPEACKMLQESLQDIRAGRLHDHEDVRNELLNVDASFDSMDRNGKARPRKASKKGPPGSV